MLSRGFTLVELLVVISIIGMLSSVVISSLNSARVKAADVAVQEQLLAIRTSAEINYPTGAGGYDNLCDFGTPSYRQFEAAAKNGGTNATAGIDGMCLSSGTVGAYMEEGVVYESDALKTSTPNTWAVTMMLKGGGYFCVDSSGVARVQTGRGLDNSPLDMSCS